MTKTLGLQRLLALFFAALLLLNYPLLAIWNTQHTVFGLPLFATALFLLWAVLVAVMAWMLEHCED